MSNSVLIDESTEICSPGMTQFDVLEGIASRVKVEIKITQGGPIDVLLLDEPNFIEYKNGFYAGEPTFFYYHREGSRIKVTNETWETDLFESGASYFILENDNFTLDGAIANCTAIVSFKITTIETTAPGFNYSIVIIAVIGVSLIKLGKSLRNKRN